MRHETQDALLASIGVFFGVLGVIVWVAIDPFEVEVGLLISFMVIAMDQQSLGFL